MGDIRAVPEFSDVLICVRKRGMAESLSYLGLSNKYAPAIIARTFDWQSFTALTEELRSGGVRNGNLENIGGGGLGKPLSSSEHHRSDYSVWPGLGLIVNGIDSFWLTGCQIP